MNQNQVWGLVRHGANAVGTWLTTGGLQHVWPAVPLEVTSALGVLVIYVAAHWSVASKSDKTDGTNGPNGGLRTADGNDIPVVKVNTIGGFLHLGLGAAISAFVIFSIVLSLLLTAGCATTAQGKTEQGLAAIAQTKKEALKGWAVYVVQEQDRIATLTGDDHDKAQAALNAARAKVQKADRIFQLSWTLAYDGAKAGTVLEVPADVTAHLEEIKQVLADLNVK